MNPNFSAEQSPIKLYRHPVSGHCHRVQLMLSFLDLPVELVDMDLANGANKTPDYLAISPFGQIPAIDDSGETLFDSNAILVYLAKRYQDNDQWYPADPLKSAQIQQWLSVAAGQIASGPATARLIKLFGTSHDFETASGKAKSLFNVIDPFLAERSFLVGQHITIADVACYSYIARAPEGGISLAPFPCLRAWLTRIEAQPKFVAMVKSGLPA